MTTKAKLVLDGNTFELPIIEGKEGGKAIDISKLRAETGYVTIDTGYMNTGSCYSAITYLNGESGILRYRGYPIEQIAEESNFLETSYLLYHGELPNNSQYESFEKSILKEYQLPENVHRMLSLYPEKTHPMAMLSGALVALSGFYPELGRENLNEKEEEMTFKLLLNHMKSITASIYRQKMNKSIIPSDPSLSYCGDFLNMMFGDGHKASVDPVMEKALDILLVLHADHSQNCSTSTVRMVGSSKANLFASVAAGANALWGSSHGGANQAVIEMLEMIKKDGGDYKKYIEKAKDKNDPFKLMGFGHRVYKNFDPRAKIIKGACDSVLAKMGVNDPILDIAKGLEEVALKDPYFVEKKLYPNVDFYSGIIYKALGIPYEMFTVMFALGRLPGWIAQWKELVDDAGMKIGRPRQVYTGSPVREYIAKNKR